MSFRDIQGHDAELRALARAIAGDRVAHAYLLAGPEGVGKGRVARAFASALNCTRFDGEDSCGVCADCEGIEAATHQNLFLLAPTDKDGNPDPNGLIRIAEVRRLQSTLKYKVDSGKKVAIVEAADKLMPAAANAFLKTLEEPPPDSVILLVTSRATDLLPTIVSRCQRVGFRPMPAEVVAGILLEREGVPAAEAESAARMGAGSVSSALEYVRSGAHQARSELAGTLSTLRGGDTLEVMQLAGALSRRDDLAEVLDFLKVWIRDRLVVLEGAPELAVQGVDTAGGQADGRALVDAFYAVESARSDITPPRYANRLLVMETLLFRLSELGAFA